MNPGATPVALAPHRTMHYAPPALLRAYPIAQRPQCAHHCNCILHSVCTARWGERHIPVTIHGAPSRRRTCAASMPCDNDGCASTTPLLAPQVWRIPSAFPTRVTAVLRSDSTTCISRLHAPQATHNRGRASAPLFSTFVARAPSRRRERRARILRYAAASALLPLPSPTACTVVNRTRCTK